MNARAHLDLASPFDAAGDVSPPAACAPEAAGRWAAAVVRFNLDPVSYTHASWLPAWADRAAPRVRRELSRGLLRGQGVDALFDWTLPDRASRLFLLPAPARDRVALAVGVASHRDTLRRVVRQDQLTLLRSGLGGTLSALWLGVAESVPRTADPLVLSWAPFDSPSLVRTLTDAGHAQLLRLLDPADPARRASAGRARLCVPRGHRGAVPLPPLPTSEATALGEAIARELIPEWAPEWTWLF